MDTRRGIPAEIDPRDRPLEMGSDFMIRRGIIGYWYIADANGKRIPLGIDFGTFDQADGYARYIGYAICRVLDEYGNRITPDQARMVHGVRH